MPYTLGPRQTFEALPTADYKLTLKSWREIVEDKDTQYSKKGDIRVEWNWIVAVPGAEDQDRRDWSNVPATFSDKSTFVHIVIALGIVDSLKAIEEGATVDPDQGIGKSCIGTIVKSLKPDNKTWTDKITAYAPLPAQEAPAKPKSDMASKLRERLSTLMAFAGEPNDPPAGLDQKALKEALNLIGAKPISPRATHTLTEQIELANTMGINDFDDTPVLGLSLKDALVLYEKITARLDA
jgi:hypothetical protein